MVNFKFNYLFENEKEFLVEIKRVDLPDDSLKSDIYYWFIIYKVTINLLCIDVLNFISTDNHYRKFEECEIYFNDDYTEATMMKDTVSYIYNKININDIGSATLSIMLHDIEFILNKKT